ncbi:MAG: DegT/DnrJ/EryC1/StrS family aminotransferase [Burkholderiales bacterium]|nr:DegT/DnrJ/EryC1/StrS family aminotransferase [Burkholderiales bacterium]
MSMTQTLPRIPLFKVGMPPRAALMPALEAVLYSGQIGEGQAVVDFEAAFGRWLGNENMLSFNSGTAALHTALHLVGVRPGDEVIATPMTAEPSNLAILHAGGVPVWSDVNPDNGNIDPASVAACITPHTRAILAVHYGGIPVDIDALRKIADAHGIPVIEDAAHALGARWQGRPLGQHSEVVMFSLQAIKHMTTVDGGMLAFNGRLAKPDVLSAGRRFRWFGIDRAKPRTEVDVAEVGWKYHMNNVTATIGLVQLTVIDALIAAHNANGRFLDAALADVSGIRTCVIPVGAEASYWFYTVLAEDRAGLERHLAARGIDCSRAHRRNDAHSVFAASRRPLPGLDKFWEQMLHIPCGWWVGDAERERIVAALREGW